MNSCNFIGRLANDPRTRRDKVGDEILVTTYFNLVVERAFSQSKQTYDVLPMKAVGSVAETCEKWLVKGKKIGISARAEHLKYQKGSKWFEHTLFRVLQIYFVDTKGEQEANAISDEVRQIELDPSGLEETEYQGVDFSALD